MTMKLDQEPKTVRRVTGNKKLWLGIATGVVAVAVGAFLVWYFVFRDDAPASVNSTEAAEAREEALAAAGGPAVESLDGEWAVDTSVGTFADGCLTDVCDATFAGFRIDEELASIGAKTVVGRSPAVTGSLSIDGTTITAAEFVVDMGQLSTDDSRRNNAIRGQAIETDAFPEARFSLTQPIELGSLPEVGTAVSVEATGDFTIHGVTREEAIPLTASFDGRRISVFGELGPIQLSDYDIAQPRAAVVLSVEDNATMELQLFFAKDVRE